MFAAEVVAAIAIRWCERVLLVRRSIRYYLPISGEGVAISTNVALGVGAAACTIILRVCAGRWPEGTAAVVVVV